jgi:hypothetical protein
MYQIGSIGIFFAFWNSLILLLIAVGANPPMSLCASVLLFTALIAIIQRYFAPLAALQSSSSHSEASKV